MVAVAENIVEVEIDGPRNQNVVFRPLQRRVRGRLDFQRVREPNAMKMVNRFPDPIPGQRLAINIDTGEAWLIEPLHFPEHEDVRRRIELDERGNKRVLIAPERESLGAVDKATWLYWLAAEVKNGTARLVRGTLPDRLPGRPRRSFYSDRPNEQKSDNIADAMQSMAEALKANTTVLQAIAAKLGK